MTPRYRARWAVGLAALSLSGLILAIEGATGFEAPQDAPKSAPAAAPTAAESAVRALSEGFVKA
ncbi:MAG: hypothetical protein AB7I30_16320, partial [Isosphaeraceae bacterium]